MGNDQRRPAHGAQSQANRASTTCFGIVGFPVQGVAAEAQKAGITYIGMRNEQAASYAAHAAGYLTGRPQACLTVSGPGVIHAFAGLANAKQNCWPMILIGGASPVYQKRHGRFSRKSARSNSPRRYCKYSHAIEHAHRIPYYVKPGGPSLPVRSARSGLPGLPRRHHPSGGGGRRGNRRPQRFPEPPRTLADPDAVEAALTALESAENVPWSSSARAWPGRVPRDEIREFIERTQLPFLNSPMGKGTMPDDDSLSVGAARSTALREADLVFLMGAPSQLDHALRPCHRDSTRTCASSNSTSNPKRSVPTCPPKSPSWVTARPSLVSSTGQLDNRQWFYPSEDALGVPPCRRRRRRTSKRSSR